MHSQELNKQDNYRILNFNKIFVNFKKLNSIFFFLTNNFFLINNLSLISLNFLSKNLIISDFKNSGIIVKRNNHFFFKINNKYRNFLRYFKYLIKFKFKFNRLFNYTFFLKLTFKKNLLNYPFFLRNSFSTLEVTFLNKYFKLLLKDWSFLTGYSISPFWWDLYSKKNWIRKSLSFNSIANRYFFNRLSKNNNKKRIRKYDMLKYKNLTKKYVLNNYLYLKNFNKKHKYSSLKHILKIAPNFRLFKKKNYDWFLSKPYLFLNTYKNFKINKHYSNYLVFFIFKKYFRFFNILKRLNFNVKHKKTNNFFFAKIFSNSDLKSKSYKNKYFKIYSNSKKNLPFFRFCNSSSVSKMKRKFLKKRMSYFWFFKLIYSGRILKKNKLMFNYKIFLNKKMKLTKFSRKSKKRNIFIKSFKIIKKNIISRVLSFKLKKFKSKFKFKYRFKIKFNKLNSKNNNGFRNKTILRFRTRYNKLPLKFFFIKLNKNRNLRVFIFNKNYNYGPFFKWKVLNSTKLNKTKKIKMFSKKNVLLSFKKIKNSTILKKTRKPFFFTKTKLNFSLKFYGFLFLNNNIFNYLNNKHFSYNTKKFLYSFSYKNEIQRFILRKYVKNNFLADSLLKNSVFSNYLYSYNILNNGSYHAFFNNFLKSDHGDNFNFFNFINKKDNHIQSILNKNLSPFLNWTYYNNQTDYHKNTHTENSDFNIKRIRFKPGYMTLWRDVRSVLKDSLSLRFRYQHKLTNYLAKYKKFINFRTFLSLEMRLINVLVKSRLFNDLNLASIFIEYNLVYMNGILCNNQNLQVFVGDFIQIIVNLKYYIVSRWFLNLNLKKKNKIKNVFRKKNSAYAHSDEKKKSYTMPKWILFNKNLFDDCANYLEVDYFTLSSFVLYEPFLWSDINPYNLLEQKFSIINLYNWKYIT